MRPAWRLAINSLSERRSRTALLTATVALSAALIVAVSCAMESLNAGIRDRIRSTVGTADLRIEHVGNRDLDAELIRRARAWPESAFVLGRSERPVALVNGRNGGTSSTTGFGLDLPREYELRPLRALEGRLLAADGEILLDAKAAEELEAEVGDELDVEHFGEPVRVRVVGIVERVALGMLGPPQTFMTQGTMWRISGEPGKVREIDVVLREGVDAGRVAEARRDEFERGVLLRVTAKITSGLDKNLQSSQIGLVIASVLSFLSASFIIMTGLTTGVTERQRELAVIRCVGGRRAQLAELQLVIGGLIGASGAIIGVPLGIAGAWVLIGRFPEQLPGGFAMNRLGAVMAIGGSVLAGLLGAAWPAWQSARTSPLTALSVRARRPTRRGILLALIAGLAGAGTHILIMTLPHEGSTIFWLDVTIGMPAQFVGYFLLSVPLTLGVVFVAAPVVTRLLRLPKGLLDRTIRATCFRHGFTSGAMMVGLAMFVAIWSNGRSALRDWLDRLEFADAFVNAVGMTEETQRLVEAVPGVDSTCAITLQSLETDAFGIRGLTRYKTTFIAFEPDRFFPMAPLTFIQGDEETARRRLADGDAILVAREFMVAKGLGVGDRLTLRHEGTPHEFEIVGVVTSPGLDIAYKYFNIGREYLQQAVNAVFGTRRTLTTLFGNDGIDLLQLDLAEGVDDEAVLEEIKQTVRRDGAAVISIGSGRSVKSELRIFLKGTLLIFSTVAVSAMLVACFGVANLIVAGIQARQFEFGVLRAIGAQRSLLARLVIGEALLIALTACILGTVMGMQASWASQRMYRAIVGLLLTVRIPPGPVAAGWAILTLITLGAAAPAIWRLMRRRPRELLAAMRG